MHRVLRVDGRYHDQVPYIDDQSLLKNLWSIMGDQYTIVDIRFLPVVKSMGLTRKTLPEQAEVAIRS